MAMMTSTSKVVSYIGTFVNFRWSSMPACQSCHGYFRRIAVFTDGYIRLFVCRNVSVLILLLRLDIFLWLRPIILVCSELSSLYCQRHRISVKSHGGHEGKAASWEQSRCETILMGMWNNFYSRDPRHVLQELQRKLVPIGFVR